MSSPSPKTSGHSFEEHKGEVRLAVTAGRLQDLFAEAGRALAELMLGELPEPSDSLRCHSFEVHASDRGSLLADWLNELIFRSELAKEVFTRFEVDLVDETCVRTRAWGMEPLALKTAVKAATYHRLSVEPYPGGWRASVVLDV